MEEVVGGFLSGLSRSILSLIRWFIVEALLEFSFYWIGKISLLILTLGRYPRGNKAREDEGKIACFGILVSLVIIITAVYLSQA